MRLSLGLLVATALIATGCSSPTLTNEIGLTQITFPNGARIDAETMSSEFELLKGMMYRESLGPNRGMLFIHPEEEIFHYWMFQTKIPLDIIWMDHDHRVVEMSLNTPPCISKSAGNCTNYGGNFKSKYALEVNAGFAAKSGLKVGDILSF